MMPITIKHSESLYFPTGDIVLLSLPQDDVVTAFKIDRVFLIRSSPVFEGMFALPLSGDVESYDDVPLVRLQDEPEHLTMFLKALYDSRCIPWQKLGLNTIKMVEGTLLLATKYQIDHLRERIISLLERDSELDQWDVNEAETEIQKKRSWSISNPDPCEAIRLARRCDVPSILPAAFYRLSCIQGMEDHRVPDSLQRLVFGDLSPPKPTANFSLLSAYDSYCLAVGQNAILHFFNGAIDNAVSEAADKRCSPDSTCWKNLEASGRELRQKLFQQFGDPLSLMIKGDGYPLDVHCRLCRHVFHEALRARRKNIWESLPSLFMLKIEQ